jgi:hypothetical protein
MPAKIGRVAGVDRKVVGDGDRGDRRIRSAIRVSGYESLARRPNGVECVRSGSRCGKNVGRPVEIPALMRDYGWARD